MDDFTRSNQELWDEWTGVNAASDFYDLAGFLDGSNRNRLRPYEIEEIGDVTGKDLLHVQCHFGMDTLSWAELGAHATGIDFSAAAIDRARRLSQEVNVPAEFVQSDVYSLPDVLDRDFDVVYTSRGVLGWLPDIARWGEVVARFVRPGGIFYITEIHPITLVFDEEPDAVDAMRLRYSYWETQEPITLPVQGSYADPDAQVNKEVEHGWNHGLGEIVTALATAGLHIESLREYPFLEWPAPFLEARDDGTWRLPGDMDGTLPLFYSLKATKPL